MPTLAQIASDRATCTMGEGDAALHIDYRPRLATTPAMLKVMRDAGRLRDSTDPEYLIDTIGRLADALCQVIASWDLMEADGTTVVPLTRASFEHIDVMTQAELLGAIMEDAQRSLGELKGMRSRLPTAGTLAPAGRATSSRVDASRKRSR